MTNDQQMEEQKKETEDAEQIEPIMEPPDGGWGWIVVIASFMCNVIVDGIIFSFGIFLKEFTPVFHESKAKIAWIGSLQAGFYLMAGPVVSALANVYGCRPVTIAGSIIAAIAFGISYFATSVNFLIVSMGLLGGIGFGFIFLPAIVTVGFYFDHKRALATGIAVCGSGVGAFAMAPLVQIMVNEYGWQGCLLILSALILNCTVFGSFFRPLEPKTKPVSSSTEPTKPLLLRIKEARDMLNKWDSDESVSSGLLVGSQGSQFGWKNANGSNMHSIKNKSYTDQTSGGSNTDSTISHTESNNSPPPSYSEVVSSDMLPCLSSNPYSEVTSVVRRATARWERRSPSRCLRKGSCQPEMLRPFYRQDIFFSASLLRLPEFRSQPDMKHYRDSVTKIPEVVEESNNNTWYNCSSAMTDTFRQMLDLSLLTSPTFILLSSSGFLTLAGFFIPFIYIIDRAVLIGISDQDATILLSTIGITNTIGRVFSGWMSDRPRINALFINNCALTLGGVATALSPFINNYYLLILYCAIFGFSIACFAALRSIIAVDLLGLEKLTNAFGLLLLFQGIATIIGSPVAGLFYDLTGSYDASFYIAGALISISGLMCFPLPRISRWEKNRKNRTESIVPEVIVTSEMNSP